MRLYIDYGGTNFRYQYDNDEVLTSFSFEVNLKEFLDEQITKNEITFIGVSFAGVVEDGKIISSPNIEIEPFDVEKYVKEKYDIPLKIRNDINGAALVEAFTRNSKILTLFYIGTGFGGGTVLEDDILIKGANSLGGEIGHIPFKKTPFTCGCGRNDCLELSCSGGAIDRWNKFYKLELDEPTLTCLRESDNKKAKIVYDNFFEALKYVFHTTLNFIDPDYLILGGGVAKEEKEVIEFLENERKNLSYQEVRKNLKIEMSSFENGSLEGAKLH